MWSDDEVKVAQLSSDSLRPHGLYGPQNSLDQHTGVGGFSLLQGIFSSQGSNQVSHIAGGFFSSWATRNIMLYLNSFMKNQ